MQFPPRNGQQGFTLIELSIVLVIIGLIVGGILVGQNLIKAAEVRATVAQIEKYNTAVNTFRTRFNGVPGDVRDAANYGLTALAGTNGLGDGDRLLESSGGNIGNLNGEITLFWEHLSQANLVDGSFVNTNFTVGTALPRTKLDNGGIGVYFAGSSNYFQIGAADAPAAGGAYTFANNLTAEEAYNMDVKLDDGLPNTGQTIMRGSQAAGPNQAPQAGAGNCNDCATGLLATSVYYNLVTCTNVVCQLRARMN